MAQLNSWVSLSCSSPEKIGLLTFVIYGSTSSLLHQTLTCDHHLDEMYQQSALLLACMMAWIWKITYRGLVAYVEGLTLCPLLTAETLRLLDEPATRASLIALESAAPDHFTSPLALWRSCFLSLARWKEANQVGWVTFIALIWVWKFNRHLLRLRLRVKYCLLYLLVMMWCMFLFAFFWYFWPLQTQLRSPAQFHQIETETVCHTWSSILSTVSFLIFWMTVRAVCTSRNSNQTKENARLFARWALPVGMCPCWWSWLKLVCDFKLVSNHKLSTCNIRECAVSECDPSPRTKAWTSRAWTFLMAIMRHCERTRHEEVMTRRADCCRATGRLWSGSGRCTAGGWKKWEKWKEHCNYVQFYKYEWYHHIISYHHNGYDMNEWTWKA